MIFLLSSLAASTLKWRDLQSSEKTRYTYSDFLEEFEKTGTPTSKQTFHQNLKRIHSHNSQSHHTWRQGVNYFTDLTEEEFRKYKGKAYVPRDPVEEKFLSTFDAGVESLPASIDWRSKGAVTDVKNQGGCGSCWAFSSAESVESAVFMATGILPTLAPQEFVDCIPNPNSCGGTGGCEGSTEEYGFAWAMLYGLANESDYPYTAKTGTKCKMQANNGKSLASAGITNFVKLPANDYDSLMQAIATVGPVSISVDASWSAYESGVYQGCTKNKTTIDHAVQLVGYGSEKGQDYFLIRNS
jgi:cathepsin L